MERRTRRPQATIVTILAMALACLALHADSSAASDRFKGRLLSDALRALQAAGLRIVFSSETITPELRVIAEPRSKVPAEILEEVLKPHGLTVERGPGLVLIVVRSAVPVRNNPAKPISRSAKPGDPAKTLAISGYAEQVVVTAEVLDRPGSGAGAEMILGADELKKAGGVLNDDPARVVQSLPRVAATGDFRSEFSVRGSAHRHIGVVVDGVATPWLQHAAYGRGDVGSMTMFGSEVLEQATLQAGAYPQRDGDWLGAQMFLRLREGSRAETRVRASMSGINGAVVAEGPLGRSQRGSWLVAARQSYLDWPVKRRNALDPSVFGFADALAKLAYDVRANHKFSVTALAGRSGIDGPDDRAPRELADGTNVTGLLSLRWDATLAHNFRVSQQVSAVSHRFRNKYQNGDDAAAGVEADASYRVDVIRTLFGGLFEAGAQARRTHATYSAGFDGAASDRSAYVNFSWTPAPRLTLTPGLRVSTASLASRATVGRWILGHWALRDGWTINASAGVSHQFSGFPQAFGAPSQSNLEPERAAHAEVGVSQRLGRSVRWQASLFSRRERDVHVPAPPGLACVDLLDCLSPLAGSSSGVEVLLERGGSRGLSGWAGYSYGKSRYTDRSRGETFWADFDQRHGLTVHARYAFPNRTAAAVTFRAGSNFPIPGYLSARQEKLFADAERNSVRLPAYARLDISAERRFDVASRRVTIFGELVNVLNRRNIGPAHGVVRQETGEAVGFTEPLFPRMPLAGLRIEF